MKIALVYSFEESSWFSCTIILRNLIKAYELEFGEKNIIHVNYSRQRAVNTEDLKKIIPDEVEKIIFIDHKPTPIDFLIQFKKYNEISFTEKEYIIHIFGDYPLYLVEWRSVNEYLEDLPVKYICASKKQKKFIEKFVKQEEIVFVSPFPVDKKDFYRNEKAGELVRSQLNIKKELLILYTGRLSYQKRIVDLIEQFGIALNNKTIPENAKLVLVGNIDQLGIFYLGYEKLPGEYFREISKSINSLGKFSNQVIYVGEVENKELLGYLNAADLYVSLSTYHDEDYGMSVAEALSCGTPTIITNWAGYQSFQIKEKENYCGLVPVQLSKSLPDIDFNFFQNLLESFKTKKINREEMSLDYQGYLSINYCAQNLGRIARAPSFKYEAGTELMISLTNEQFLRGSELFKKQSLMEFNTKYYKVYDVYAE